jgi:hypothetical protein
MPAIPALISFSPSTLIKSADVNANFASIRTNVNSFCLFTDTSTTITVANTWTISQAFSGGFNASGTVTLSSGATVLSGTTIAATGATANLATLTVTAAATVSGTATFKGNSVISQFNAGNSGAAITLDFGLNGNNQRVTLTATCTITLTNAVAGGVYTVEAVQDGTGGRTVTWAAGGGAAVIWTNGVAPVVTATLNRADLFSFLFDGVPATPKYIGLTSAFNLAV